MNIIQVQDRLKGLPEDALVNYVKNPTGPVPIYLALGEINRRKEMEAKFNANKEEKANIKDQLISGLEGWTQDRWTQDRWTQDRWTQDR